MTQTQSIIKQLLADNPVQTSWRPSQFIDTYWTQYQENHASNPSVNGAVFEELLMLALLREGLQPIYYQAKLAFVPNVILDIVLYNRKTPVTISAKTTLRERWKQADLEAMATKYVHRQAQCYVVTLSESEVLTRRNEQNSYMGIDQFVLAHRPEFDALVDNLKRLQFTSSESIKIIETDSKFYDHDTAHDLYGVRFG